jgi:hypothetical protein
MRLAQVVGTDLAEHSLSVRGSADRLGEPQVAVPECVTVAKGLPGGLGGGPRAFGGIGQNVLLGLGGHHAQVVHEGCEDREGAFEAAQLPDVLGSGQGFHEPEHIQQMAFAVVGVLGEEGDHIP